LASRDYIEDIMYGRRSSLVMGAFLFLLSLLYGTVVRFRVLAYACGLLRSKKLPLQVVSVGNLTVGGTGKTPVVIQIAGLLQMHGRKPLVLSRGYGRADASRAVIVSDGASSIMDARSGGDEPALIALRLPGVPVVAGSDRYQAGMFAIERLRPDVIVLDDGFQHLRLSRDRNILLIDASDPFGNRKLFPAGILREPLEAMQRADIVILTRADSAGDLEALKRTIIAHTPARIFTARHAPRSLVNVASGEERPLASLRGMPVLAFAGIARPDSFASLLKDLGAEVRAVVGYPDHYQYTPADLTGLVQRAKEQGAMLVTTEKDGVRFKDMASEGIWTLRIDLEVLEKQEWEKVLLQGL
jgi:tetraacyldisaccharide 4'-kinase